MKTKVIVVVNQKGGVGKSTVAFHLAHAALVKEIGNGGKVLGIDLDSQGNLSQYLTGELDVIDDTDAGVGLLLEGKPVVMSHTSHPLIDLLHGHSKLDRYDNDEEVEARAYSPEIRSTIRGLGYDYVIIDTPPAVGLRHLAALYWADVAVIPMEPVVSGISGFQNVLSAIENHIAALNPKLTWFALMNRANMRVKSHREKDAWMRKNYGKQVIGTLSTRSAISDAMEESPAQPVWSRKGAPKELRDTWLEFCSKIIK
jgi:chromosome partitioning protein